MTSEVTSLTLLLRHEACWCDIYAQALHALPHRRSVTTYRTTCCARAFNVAEHAIAVCGLQTNALQNA